MRTSRWLVPAGLVSAVAARRRWRNWGSTAEERWTVLPGDDLVPEPALSATRAITVRATPEEVWRSLDHAVRDRTDHHVAASEPGRSLVLRRGRADRPRLDIWSFTIVPQRVGCRLVARSRRARHSGWFGPMLDSLSEVRDPLDLVMTRRVLLEVAARAESAEPAAHLTAA